MDRAAFCTRPVSILQFQFLIDCAARRTGLGGWIEPVRFENRASSQCGCVLEIVFQRAKASVTDGARQAAVLHYTAHVQVFDHNRVKAAREVVGQFVQNRLSLIGNSLVQTGKGQLGFRGPVRIPSACGTIACCAAQDGAGWP